MKSRGATGLVLSILALVLAGCQQPVKPTIYCWGPREWDPENAVYYLVDGVKTVLPGGVGDTHALGIRVSGATTYAWGSYNDGERDIACFWANGRRTDLPGGQASSVAWSLCVAKGRVYTAGHYENDGRYVACYWVDGTRVDLPGGRAPGDANAHSILVSGDTVYVAGYWSSGDSEIACYWANGLRTDLSPGTESAMATSIGVSRGVVYTAGWFRAGEASSPCYWKGTARFVLPCGNSDNGGAATCMVISGGAVFIGGLQRHGSDNWSTCCYWRDGVRTDLPGGAGPLGAFGVLSIHVRRGVVYTTGRYFPDATPRNGVIRGRPCYWTNDVRTDPPCAGGISIHVR